MSTVNSRTRDGLILGAFVLLLASWFGWGRLLGWAGAYIGIILVLIAAAWVVGWVGDWRRARRREREIDPRFRHLFDRRD